MAILCAFCLYSQETNYAGNFRIGLALDAGGIGDLGRNDAILSELDELVMQLSGAIRQPRRDGVASAESGRFTVSLMQPIGVGVQRRRQFNRFSGGGYDLLIAIGPFYFDFIQQAADRFSNTQFVLIDGGYIEGLKPTGNLTCVTVDKTGVAFIMGALAGSIARNEQGDVGVIAANDLPEVRSLLLAFAAGVVFAAPELMNVRDIDASASAGMSEYIVNALNFQVIGRGDEAYLNTSNAKTIALNLIERGVAVLFHIAGIAGGGVIQAARDAGAYVIGSPVDQRSLLSVAHSHVGSTAFDVHEHLDRRNPNSQLADVILSSMRIDYARIIELLIDRFIRQQGSLSGGYVRYALDDERIVDWVSSASRAGTASGFDSRWCCRSAGCCCRYSQRRCF